MSREQSEMELKLIKVFENKPEYITFKSFKLWEKIGPLPIKMLVSNETIQIEGRYKIEEQKYPGSGGYYIGQVGTEKPSNE